jgi:hypothetical protein
MVAINPNYSHPFDGSDPIPPVNRVRDYFEASRDGWEMPVSKQRQMGNERGYARSLGKRTAKQIAEEIRIHAWLIERMHVLHYEEHALWPRLRRFGSRLARFLGLPRG